MLIPIKIICGCGQKYAFDVTPVNSRMPGPVQCPRCGADGTAVANAIISLALGVRPASNLPAQQNAERLVATRDVLAPVLAQAVKEAVVQELAAQRRELLRVQENALGEQIAASVLVLVQCCFVLMKKNRVRTASTRLRSCCRGGIDRGPVSRV